MTAPIEVGDVVRIGDLPAGAVVAWPADGGETRHVTVTGDRVSGGRGRYVERNGETCGCLLDDDLACLVSLPPAAVDAAPVEESAAVAHWHTLAREAEAALYAMTAERDEAVAKICGALGMAQTPYQATPDGAVLAIRDLRAELIAHAARTQEARYMLAARDAQEGDRIAAWAARSDDVPCARCWYPAPYRLEREKHETLCDECRDDDRDAAAGEVAP